MAGSEEINFYQKLKTSISLWKKKLSQQDFFYYSLKLAYFIQKKNYQGLS